MLLLRVGSLISCLPLLTLAHGDSEPTVSVPSSEDALTVPGSSAFNNPARGHVAIEDKSGISSGSRFSPKLTVSDQASASVVTLTIPGRVETSYITESARVTVVTISASSSEDGSLPIATSSNIGASSSFSLSTETLTEGTLLPTLSGVGAPWSLPLVTETLTGGFLLPTLSDSDASWSLPLFTETLSDGSLLPTATVDSLTTRAASFTVGVSSLPTTQEGPSSAETAGVTLGADPLPASAQDPSAQAASITVEAGTLPAPTDGSSFTSATVANQAPTVPTQGLPPSDPTIAPIFTAAPIANPIYSLFTSLPNTAQPHKQYNASSSIIPVWSPALLGNAYGGGLIRPPTVFALVAPQATGTLRGIPPAYGYTVFPLSEPSPTATPGGGLDTGGDANYTYSVVEPPSSSLYSKNTPSGTAAGPSASGPSVSGPSASGPSASGPSASGPSASASLGFGGGYLGNGTYQLQVEGPPAPMMISSATKEIIGVVAMHFSIFAILASKILEIFLA